MKNKYAVKFYKDNHLVFAILIEHFILSKACFLAEYEMCKMKKDVYYDNVKVDIIKPITKKKEPLQ